jgi:RNA polymerase sigma-70 factor, ECF subfamily
MPAIERIEHCERSPDASPSAFANQLIELLPTLRPAAIALTRSKADADDLIQTTALRALSARHQFCPWTNMRAWLYRIMRNEFIDLVRKPGHNSSSLDSIPESFFTVAPHQNLSLAMRDVMRAFAKLPTEHREALYLYAVEGSTYEQIADMQACALGTVKSRLARARLIMKELIEHMPEASTSADLGPGAGAGFLEFTVALR